MRPRLLEPDPTLERVIAAKRPMSLYFSRTQWLPGLLVGAGVAIVFGAIYGWVVAVFAVALALGLGSVFVVRRIDVDTDGITLLPLLPFMPTQRLRFDSLGPFTIRLGPYKSVCAPVDSSASYKLGGVLRRGEVGIQAGYMSAFSDTSLRAADMQELFERYRSEPAHPVHIDSDLMVPADRLRRKERVAIGLATVAVIFAVAIIQTLVSH